MKLSICIPTFNRAGHLANCLESIIDAGAASMVDVEICVSDNGSSDDTEAVVLRVQQRLPLRYHRNAQNLGIPANFLNVVGMATGEFAWLLGDDDLLVPSALVELRRLIDAHPRVDFFYVNSYHLSTEYVGKFPAPFRTSSLPTEMPRFSSWATSGEMPFLDLIDPRISFDFLGGMFLAVFRRAHWTRSAHVLDPTAVADLRTFSSFDNTFPHVKIFAHGFAGSMAYVQAEPLSVCLTGAREWSPMYPFVRSIRLVEALDEYRRAGLPLWRYLRNRNFALRHFVPNLIRMLVRRDRSGVRYVQFGRVLRRNCLFPAMYLSALGLIKLAFARHRRAAPAV